MGADDTLRVEPAVMQGFAASLDGAAEHLAVQLAELDAQVGQMLGGWRGASGSAYGSAWELWHRGAGEVVGRGDVGCRWAGGAVAGAAAERLCRRGCAAVGGRWRRWRPEGLGVGGPVYRDDLAERGFDKATCGGCGVAQRGHAVRAD